MMTITVGDVINNSPRKYTRRKDARIMAAYKRVFNVKK